MQRFAVQCGRCYYKGIPVRGERGWNPCRKDSIWVPKVSALIQLKANFFRKGKLKQVPFPSRAWPFHRDPGPGHG